MPAQLGITSFDILWTKGVALLTTFAGAGLVFVFFYVLATTARTIVDKLAERDSERGDILRLIAQAAKAGIVVFGAVTALGTAGVDITGLIAGLGLTGFALGFALKDVLSGTVAGLIILLSRPFSSGHRLTVTGFEGKVERMDLRYVTLISPEGKRFLIPNSTVLTSPLTVVKDAAPALPETEAPKAPAA